MLPARQLMEQQLQQLRQVDMRVPRVIPRDRTDPFDKFTEEEFRERFRLSKQDTRDLIEEIRPNAHRVMNGRGM